MVKIDTADLVKQLEDLEKLITRKLEAAVRGFAEEVATAAVRSTPVGDYDKYQGLYDSRTTWPKTPGLARGNWQYTEGALQFRMIADPSGDTAIDGVGVNAKNYKLGDNFYIGNSVPYIGTLEQGASNQAPAGIMQVAEGMVLASYQVNLQRDFDATK